MEPRSLWWMRIVRIAIVGCAVVATTVTAERGLSQTQAARPRRGELQFRVTDGKGEAVACQIQLWDQDKRPVQPDGVPFWYDHWVCDGESLVRVDAGEYTYRIERGPEYRARAGRIRVPSGKQAFVTETLERRIHLRSLNWFSADLHIHRPAEHAELLMRAADLDVGPVITWWNQRDQLTRINPPPPTWRQFDSHRFTSLTAGEDERQGGALLFFGMDRAIDITKAQAEFPSPLQFVDRAHKAQPNVWVDVEKPFWWDVPIWVASGEVDSIGIANNHMCRDQMLENEAWGFPRNTKRLPAPLGNGFWTQEIYYHLLNCGVYLPPTAGSASGVLKNPVGYNRVYVHSSQNSFAIGDWWESLRAGACFVTNGPLLLCRANGRLPGARIDTRPAAPDVRTKVELSIQISSADSINEVEVINNGKVALRIPLADSEHHTIQAEFEPSAKGWFLVRAITNRTDTFRFASTGPFYLEDGSNTSYLDIESIRFFISWVQQRIERLRAAGLPPEQFQEVADFHRNALKYWQRKLEMARSN